MLKNKENTTEDKVLSSAFGLVFELGYIIAIPAVMFAVGGRMLDRYFDSSPLFLLVGILVAVILSSYSVYIKIKNIT